MKRNILYSRFIQKKFFFKILLPFIYNNFNSKEKITSIILNKKSKDKKNNTFTKMEIKASKNLADLNEESFNISNMPLMTYSHKKTKLLSKSKNNKKKAISQILLNNEENVNSFEKTTTFSNNNLKAIIKSNNLNNSANKNKSKSLRLKVKSKKRVNFKQNFATIIKVESYKKYNVNNYYNRIDCVNCSCIIY